MERGNLYPTGINIKGTAGFHENIFYTLKCWVSFLTDKSILFREIPKNEILLNAVECLISMPCIDRCHVQKQISEHRQITWFTLGFSSMSTDLFEVSSVLIAL